MEAMSLVEVGKAIVSGVDKMINQTIRRPQVNNFSIVNNIIEEFDPKTKDANLWLNSVDEYAVIHDWDDKTTSHLALSKLRGAAEIWYRGLPTRLFTWPQWRDFILTNFRQTHNLHLALKDMMACTADAGDSLYDYLYTKLALIYKLKLSTN
jgi:hypothetical protein